MAETAARTDPAATGPAVPAQPTSGPATGPAAPAGLSVAGSAGRAAQPAEPAPPAASSAVTLSAAESEAVGEIVRAFAAALPAERRGDAAALAADVAAGAVPADRVGLLERVCALALQTGRSRSLGSAEAERYVAAVHARTPGGAALAATLAGVNRALGRLTDRPLRGIRVSARVPGHYQVALTVGGVGVLLALSPDGVEVRQLQAG